MTAAYYNECDPKAAAWLRELIKADLIAPGDVDERSITEVQPADLVGYTQCHFFAGIGGWSLALRLAGWPDDRPVWTGSCPCQPFSAAGKGEGAADSRHLWPEWFRLIRECRPGPVFGEQVASAVGHGWLDLVSTDLEGEGYAIGATVLGAHSVGAPHIRQRLWFVAEANVDELGHATSSRWQRSHGSSQQEQGSRSGREDDFPSWNDLVWLPCRDGKARPTQSGLQPLAHGVSARVGRLRGYGNAIVPQVAAEVIAAYMDIQTGE